MFKYDLGITLENFKLFFLSNQTLDTENLYKIIKEVNSNTNKKVYTVLDKKIKGTVMDKFNIEKK